MVSCMLTLRLFQLSFFFLKKISKDIFLKLRWVVWYRYTLGFPLAKQVVLNALLLQ